MPIDEYSDSDELALVAPKIIGVPVTNSNTLAKFKIQLPDNGRGFLLVKTVNLPNFEMRSSPTVKIYLTKSAKNMTRCTRADRDSVTVFIKQADIVKNSSGGSSLNDTGFDPSLSDAANQLSIELAAKSAAMASYYHNGEADLKAPDSAGLREDDTTVTVLITEPKNGDTVVRQLRGINTDGTTTNASNVELSWSGTIAGSQSVSSKNNSWQDVTPLDPGEYQLTANVCNGKSHSVNVTVILNPAITGYTVEDIQLLNTFRWGDSNSSPEAQLIQKIAREAGLVDKSDDFSDNSTGTNVTNKVKKFAKSASGDFNLFYSGSGDKAFIDKKMDKIFGKHLSQETKNTLTDSLLNQKKAGFIDATDAFHEAMKNTLDIFFAENSVGRIISELETPVFLGATMTLMLDAAKTIASVTLNYELSQSKNGAPFVLQNKSKIELFDTIGIEVVGAMAGGVVVKAGSGAFKVVKSFFKKYEFKFKKSQKPKITADGRVIPYGKTAAESKAIRMPDGAKKGQYHEIDGQKAFYDKDGFIKLDSKFDTVLDKNHIDSGKEGKHFKAANENLRVALQKDPQLAKKMKLNKVQIRHLMKDPSVQIPPPGMTWHHHQDIGRMQLVTKEPHSKFTHTGGMATWGGGYPLKKVKNL